VPDEPKIEPPVPDQPPRSVGFLISQLGFFSSKRFSEALEPLGIGPREFLLLRFVAASAGQSQQALAERLGVPASRMVALVDDLEERGLVERRNDPEDRRVRGLHLTAMGGKTLERAAQTALEYESKLCEPLAEGERDQLIELLQKVQSGQTALRGVHPGLSQEHPGAPTGDHPWSGRGRKRR
jgi:DNA-binding MarR family transcriptional regulator